MTLSMQPRMEVVELVTQKPSSPWKPPTSLLVTGFLLRVVPLRRLKWGLDTILTGEVESSDSPPMVEDFTRLVT